MGRFGTEHVVIPLAVVERISMVVNEHCHGN
jgi:hypothetical protein